MSNLKSIVLINFNSLLVLIKSEATAYISLHTLYGFKSYDPGASGRFTNSQQQTTKNQKPTTEHRDQNKTLCPSAFVANRQ